MAALLGRCLYLAATGADCKGEGTIFARCKDQQVSSNIIYYESPINVASGEGHLEIVKYLVEKCKVNPDNITWGVNEFRYDFDDIKNPIGLYSFINDSNDFISAYIRKKHFSSHLENPDRKEENSKSEEKTRLLKILNIIITDYNIDLVRKTINKVHEDTIKIMIENRKALDNNYKAYLRSKEDYTYFSKSKRAPSPLIVASFNDKMDIVRYLFDKGANLNYQYGSGSTALDDALYNYNYDIAVFLLEKGALADKYITIPDGMKVYSAYGILPLYSCSPYGVDNEKYKIMIDKIIRLMFRNGMKKEHLSFPLAKACLCHDMAIVNILLDNGATMDGNINGEKVEEICKRNGVYL